MKHFCGRLRIARKMRGLSQGELASRAGLQPSAISHFEAGRRVPSCANLIRLAKALEVTSDALLGIYREPSVEQLLRVIEKQMNDVHRVLWSPLP